jgi:hypothetical protein
MSSAMPIFTELTGTQWHYYISYARFTQACKEMWKLQVEIHEALK